MKPQDSSHTGLFVNEGAVLISYYSYPEWGGLWGQRHADSRESLLVPTTAEGGRNEAEVGGIRGGPAVPRLTDGAGSEARPSPVGKAPITSRHAQQLCNTAGATGGGGGAFRGGT